MLLNSPKPNCFLCHCGYSRYLLNQGTQKQYSGGGRRGGLLSLVNTCGEIGLCTPCTEAHPPWRVCPPRAVCGGGRRHGGVTHQAGRMWSSPPGVWLPNHSMEFHTPCGEEGVLPARCVRFLMLIAPLFVHMSVHINIMLISLH